MFFILKKLQVYIAVTYLNKVDQNRDRAQKDIAAEYSVSCESGFTDAR